MTHPATYSPAIKVRIIEALDALLTVGLPGRTILDPFAGVGTIHHIGHALRMDGHDVTTIAVDLEQPADWGDDDLPDVLQGDTRQGDATALSDVGIEDETIAVIVTSPCYGNRMADLYDGRDSSRRATYRIALGRDPSTGSAAGLQWGPRYRMLHGLAWAEAFRVALPGAVLLLNISDHVRDGKVQPVSSWHVSALETAGWQWVDAQPIATPRMRFGANGHLRVPNEWLHTFRKPVPSTPPV